ncbi:MAG: hypothetical protein ACJ8BW_30555 [Ktedonobacteraceae bacterium]
MATLAPSSREKVLAMTNLTNKIVLGAEDVDAPLKEAEKAGGQ